MAGNEACYDIWQGWATYPNIFLFIFSKTVAL